MRCKYVYKNWPNIGKQCEMEAEPGSDYCFWHEPKDGKDISSKKINEKNLQEAYLVRAHLGNTEFEEHTNLSFANLKEADLWGTNLKKANLMGANVQGAKIWQVNLQGATLIGANFEGTSSIYRTLQKVYLSIADLQGQELKTANFKGAFSRSANFKRSNLYKADFKGAYLEGADFSECNLKEADFRGCYLSGVKLQEANLMGADLSGAFLYGLSLSGIKNLQYAYLSQAIEEIMGDIIVKLGVPKQGNEEEYWQKFRVEIIRLLQLGAETKENSKIIVDSIIEIVQGHQSHYVQVDTQFSVLSGSGKLYTQASDVYLNLKNFFRDNGLYELSGKFYVLGQIIRGKIQKVSFLLSFDLIHYRIKVLFEKAMTLIKRDKIQINDNKQTGTKVIEIDLKSYPYTKHVTSVSLAQDIKSFFQSLISWIWNIIFKATSLYGESPLLVILTAVEIILIFAMIYIRVGLALNNNIEITHATGNSLYFSLLTFLTMSYGEFSPAIPVSRVFAGIEAFSGAFILAYFVVVVSRKIMR